MLLDLDLNALNPNTMMMYQLGKLDLPIYYHRFNCFRKCLYDGSVHLFNFSHLIFKSYMSSLLKKVVKRFGNIHDYLHISKRLVMSLEVLTNGFYVPIFRFVQLEEEQLQQILQLQQEVLHISS